MEAQGANTRSQENDREKRILSKQSIDFKEERFLRNMEAFKRDRQKHIENLALEQKRKNFQANNRRRLLETEKTQKLEITRVQFSKIDGASEIKESIDSQVRVKSGHASHL